MALFSPRQRLEPRVVCPDACYGMLGCQCPQYEVPLPKPLPVPRGVAQPPPERRCWMHGEGCGDRCIGLVPLPSEQRANRAIPSQDRAYRTPVPEPVITDIHGRLTTDPLYRLPHSKCACKACAEWRAMNWQRLSSV